MLSRSPRAMYVKAQNLFTRALRERFSQEHLLVVVVGENLRASHFPPVNTCFPARLSSLGITLILGMVFMHQPFYSSCTTLAWQWDEQQRSHWWIRKLGFRDAEQRSQSNS